MSLHSNWWERLGREPKCFGHFVQGQPKCDGVPRCSHLVPCRAWTGICASLDPSKSSPPEFRATITEDGFRRVVYASCKGLRDESPTKLRLTQQWEEFFDAFRSILPSYAREVAPSEDVSRLGGLYVTQIPQKGALPSGWRIYERGVKPSPPICTYVPRPIARPTPTISIRMSLQRLRSMAPWVGEWAMLWLERDGQACAKEVGRKHVAAFGRMVGQFWAANVLDGQLNEHETRWDTPLVKVR